MLIAHPHPDRLKTWHDPRHSNWKANEYMCTETGDSKMWTHWRRIPACRSRYKYLGTGVVVAAGIGTNAVEGCYVFFQIIIPLNGCNALPWIVSKTITFYWLICFVLVWQPVWTASGACKYLAWINFTFNIYLCECQKICEGWVKPLIDNFRGAFCLNFPSLRQILAFYKKLWEMLQLLLITQIWSEQSRAKGNIKCHQKCFKLTKSWGQP